ncbi:MAG: hypothetical protein DMF93_14480 [Acidobacteria bacterium]|nr:MAG: hypothetical protein DMF93_14480 [Acidobacteriota bacterium]
MELVFATDRCHLIEDPWQDGAVAIRFYDEDASVAAILEAAADRPLDGVLVVGDRPTVIAARVAEALGLPWHPPAAAAIARHKQRTREIPSQSPIPNPQSPLFPCVVKPVALSGSRGVMRADDPGELAAALDRLRALMRSPDVRAERNDAHDTALVEQFIPGREYAVEALMHQGAMRVLAIFDKPDPLDGPFFEETIYVTPSRARDEEQRAIVDAIERAASAIGLRHGPVHAECRVAPDGVVYVLEVAARPIGGLCARTLRFAEKGVVPLFPFEELLLRHALGDDPSACDREHDASGVMMIPIPRRGIGGRRAAAKTASKAFGAKLASVRQIVALEDVSRTNQLQSTAWLIPADTLRNRPRRRRTRAAGK